MRKRQKTLLHLVYTLQKQGKKVTKTVLVKLLFIIGKETEIGQKIRFYSFYPHKFGPFSNNIYSDLTELQSLGLIRENSELSQKGQELAKNISSGEREAIEGIANRFKNQDDIIDYTYSKYPEYAVKSVLTAHLQHQPEPGMFSIGYEGNDIDSFLDALIQNQIDLLIDVRDNAFSMNFAFIGTRLAHTLKNVDIEYWHKPELGIEGKYRKELNTPEDYKKLFQFYGNTILPGEMNAIQDIAKVSEKKRVVLLCFEKHVNSCHRGTLSESLEKITGKKVTHL
ncbi:DUF488 family protein [Candidatus Micrarchaeota archaeon]|nr:DUF488 family protein [Candidatus Micrarchaeota archaeon]